VMIRSNPTGANVVIDDIAYGVTPVVANLIRKKRHSIVIKKDGYEEISRATTRGFNGWYLGNIILGGIIGLIVDPITGAMYDVEPSEINVPLPEIKEEGAPAEVAVPAAAEEVKSAVVDNTAGAGDVEKK